MKQLTGGNSIWHALDSEYCPQQISLLHVYEPARGSDGMTLPAFKRYVAQRLDGLPLHRKLVSVPMNVDYPYWVDDEQFDLDNHIHEVALKPPANHARLLAAMQKIAMSPMDTSRPPWEMHLVTGLGRIQDLPAGSFGIALKIYHAQFDGTNLAKLIHKLHTPLEELALGKLLRSEPDPSAFSLLTQAAWNRYRWMCRSTRVVGKNLPNILAALRPPRRGDDQWQPEKYGNPKTRFSCHIRTRERVFDGVDVPMADIKAIRQRVPDTTVNDVALAAAGGALRRYLSHHGELPEDPLVVLQPVSAHEEGDDIDSGSRISIMSPKVHTEIPDPFERMTRIHGSTRRVKQTNEKLGTGNVADIADVLPTNLLGAGMRLFMKSGLADHTPMGFSGGRPQ